MPVVVPLPLNAVAQVVISSRLWGQRILNTFYYQFQGVPDSAIDYRAYITALGDELNAPGDLAAKYYACVPHNQNVDFMTVQTVFPIRQRYVKLDINAVGDGAAGNSDTANLAWSMRRVSTTIGPRGVGRVQVPVGTLYRLGGELNPAVGASERTNFGIQMLQETVTTTPPATWVPVLFGISGGVTNVSPLVECVPEQTLRVMRRRTVGLGI